jgi:aminoglycoside phosphotransferase (APT) family kinase protein
MPVLGDVLGLGEPLNQHSAQGILAAVLPDRGPYAVSTHIQSGRHRLYVGRDVEGAGYLVKQAVFNANSTAAESWFYRNICPRFEYAPEPVAVLDLEHIVVLTYLDGAVRISDMAQEDPGAALEGLVHTALPLAQLHSIQLPTEGWPGATSTLPPLDPVPLDLWNSSSSGARTITSIVQQRPRLAQAYTTARNPTGPRTLVHSDLKNDNILYHGSRLYLIDWELAGIGAPAVDLGAVVGSMLCLWIDHLAIDADTSIENWVEGAALSFESLRDAVERFVTAYRHSLTAAGRVSMSTIVRAAAAWIVGRTFAEASLGYTATASQRLRLVVAESLVVHPERLITEGLLEEATV